LDFRTFGIFGPAPFSLCEPSPFEVVMGNYSADLAWQPPAETGGLSGLYYEAGDAREMVGDVGKIIRTFHGN